MSIHWGKGRKGHGGHHLGKATRRRIDRGAGNLRGPAWPRPFRSKILQLKNLIDVMRDA